MKIFLNDGRVLYGLDRYIDKKEDNLMLFYIFQDKSNKIVRKVFINKEVILFIEFEQDIDVEDLTKLK